MLNQNEFWLVQKRVYRQIVESKKVSTFVQTRVEPTRLEQKSGLPAQS